MPRKKKTRYKSKSKLLMQETYSDLQITDSQISTN
jgi:hypothetical protein